MMKYSIILHQQYDRLKWGFTVSLFWWPSWLYLYGNVISQWET